MQLINPSDGKRSEPISGDRNDLAKRLRDSSVPVDSLVLVLMEHRGEEWDFSPAPLFTVETFCTILEN